MAKILNFASRDLFEDVKIAEGSIINGHVTIRMKQLSAHKFQTIIENLPYDKIDVSSRILLPLRRQLATSATIVDTTDRYGKALLDKAGKPVQHVQVMGDHRKAIGNFLIQEGIAQKSEIRVVTF